MSLLTQWEKCSKYALFIFPTRQSNIITMQLTDNSIVSHHAILPVTWPYLHVTLASCHIYLETTSKPNRRLTGGSIPVPVSFYYCSKQWQPPETGWNQRSISGWVLKSSLIRCIAMPTWTKGQGEIMKGPSWFFHWSFFLFFFFFFSVWGGTLPPLSSSGYAPLPFTNYTHQGQCYN